MSAFNMDELISSIEAITIQPLAHQLAHQLVQPPVKPRVKPTRIVALPAPEELSEIESLKAELAELKRRFELTQNVLKTVCKEGTLETTKPHTIMHTLGHEMLDYQNKGSNHWVNSPFEAINELKPDYSGKLGEMFLERICGAGNITNVSTGDVNSKDGTYDQIINGKKVEIKTARLGKTQKKTDLGKFQHETLKKDGYDYLAFVDITPNYFYLSILSRFNLAEAHPIIGTKPTLRKGTGDVYKYDFTEKHIEKLIVAQTALKITIDTPIATIVDFINRVIPTESVEPIE